MHKQVCSAVRPLAALRPPVVSRSRASRPLAAIRAASRSAACWPGSVQGRPAARRLAASRSPAVSRPLVAIRAASRGAACCKGFAQGRPAARHLAASRSPAVSRPRRKRPATSSLISAGRAGSSLIRPISSDDESFFCASLGAYSSISGQRTKAAACTVCGRPVFVVVQSTRAISFGRTNLCQQIVAEKTAGYRLPRASETARGTAGGANAAVAVPWKSCWLAVVESDEQNRFPV